MAEHGYRAMDIGRFMYTDKVRWLSTSRHDMDRMRSRVHDGNTVRQGICSAVPSAYTGPAGQGKSLEAEETMQKLNEAVQHADKPIEGASAANEEADGLLAATRPPQSSSMDAGGPARSECPMPYFSAHRNHLRADSHSDAGLRGGMGGQLEDEEYVYSYAPYRSWDESSAACSCADAECLGNQSGEKMAALKERIQALEEQIGEVEEAKNRGMEKARGRILGSSDDAEKKPERQSAGSVFVNVDGEIGGEALRQCECETGASETSKRRMGARQSPQIALDRQGKVRRASVRGGSGGAGAYALDTDDEYDRLIQDTVDACTPGSTPPCTEMLPTSRALQLRNKYLERQLEEASEMYDSAVQDLSWNMDMLRVVEEEVEELREEKDAALREVEGLKKILYREKERSEECQEAHVDQRPCDESSCHPCKPSVAAPSGVHPTSFNFYPSRSVIIVPGAPAQILQFPPATTLHDIKDSLDYASWSGADIDDCGLAIKNIMNARSKIGIELPYPLSDEVVVIGMPPRQLGEGGDKKKSLSRSAGEAHGVKEKGADKSVKIAAWETVDKDGYVEESSKGDECSGRAIPPELRDEQVDKSVKISAWETLDGDDYVEFIPRTKDVKKSTPRREDELKNTVHVQTDHLAGSMKMKPESSYIHEAHYTPMPRPRGYCCSHCQPTSASTVNAFPYISSVSVRGGGGDSDDEEEEDGDGKSDGGGDYFLLKPTIKGGKQNGNGTSVTILPWPKTSTRSPLVHANLLRLGPRVCAHQTMCAASTRLGLRIASAPLMSRMLGVVIMTHTVVWSGGSNGARAERGGGGEDEAERQVMKWLEPKAASRSISRALSPATRIHVLSTNYGGRSAMKADRKQTCLHERDDHGKRDHCPICKRLIELSIAAVTYIKQTIRARIWTCTSKRSLAQRYVPTPTRIYQHEVVSELSYTPRSGLDRYTGLPLRPRPTPPSSSPRPSVTSAAPEPPRKNTPPIPATSPLRGKIRLPSLVELDGAKSYRGENASRGHFKIVREPEGWAPPSVAGPSDEQRFARVKVRPGDEGGEYDGMLLPHA